MASLKVANNQTDLTKSIKERIRIYDNQLNKEQLDFTKIFVEALLNNIAVCCTYDSAASKALIERTGAGHVRRLDNEKTMEGVLLETARFMDQCDCGGEDKGSSCYTCLRGYYNQNYHDRLKRSYVIDFINELFE